MQRISHEEAWERYGNFLDWLHYPIVENSEIVNIFFYEKPYYVVGKFFQKEKNPEEKLQYYLCENDEELRKCLSQESLFIFPNLVREKRGEMLMSENIKQGKVLKRRDKPFYSTD